MSSVLHVNDQNFEKDVLQSDVPVLVDFYATWCGPCKQLTPIVEQLATEYAGKAKMAKIDIDEAPGVASSHGIMAVPTLILFNGGQEVQKLTGFKAKPELVKVLNSVV
jgi:thioredoxin 1